MSQIGNAMKTIASRISRSKNADPDVTAEDRSNASRAYKEVAGIDLYNSDGEYKGLAEVLDELSVKYDDLTDAQRNYLAEQSAGTRNVNIFNAMIQSWDEAKELANAALEDTNFAESVQEKHMESMTAKMNSLKASVQDFWNSLLATDVINIGIDAVTLLVQGGEGLVTIFYKIGEVLPLVNGGLTSIAGTLATIYAGYKVYENIKISDGILAGLTKTKDDISTLFGDVKNSFLGEFASGFSKGLSREMAQTGSVTKGLFRGLTSGGKGAIAALSTLQKTMLGVGLAAVSVYAGVEVFDALTTSSKEAAEAAQVASEAYRKGQEELKSTKETIESFSAEFGILSEGVQVSPGGIENLSLTTEEFERYKEISNEIAQLFPNLISGYDAQGNAILKLKDGVRSLNEEYEILALNKARENLKSLPEYEENFDNKTGNANFGARAWDWFANAFNPESPDANFSEKEILDLYDKISKMGLEQAQKYYDDMGAIMTEESQHLKAIGFDSNMSLEEYDEILNYIKEKTPEYQELLNSASSDIKNSMQSYLSVLTLDEKQYPEYRNLSDDIITKVSGLINGTSDEQIKKLKDNGISIQTYVKDMLDAVSDSSVARDALDNLLSIDEDTSIDDQKKIIEENLSKLNELLKYDDEAELKVKLGIEDSDELFKNYDELVTKMNNKVRENGQNMINELAQESNAYLDLMKTRPDIDYSSKMSEAGWKVPKDGTNENAYYTKTYSNKEGTKSLVLTPILPDGTVVSEESLDNYAKDLLGGKEIDADVTVATFDGKDSVRQASKFSNQLKEASKYFDLSEDRVQEFLKENNINTQEEIDLLNSIISKNDTWAGVVRDWKVESFDLEGFDEQIANLSANLETVEKTIEKVNKAIDESHTSVGLSGESINEVVSAFSGLKGYDYDQLFESTAAGVHLNVQELDRLNGEYERAEKSKYDNTLKDLRQEYANVCEEINKTSSATERSDLILKRDGLVERIQQTQELQSRYEGLTSAVTKWQNAVNGTEEGDVYDSITSGVENIKKLYDEGLVGTREFKAGVQMMTNEDLSGASVGKYLSVYKNKIKEFDSYFNENGTGVENFLEKLQSVNKEWAHQNKDGSWSIEANIEDMARELDLSQSAITEIFKKLNDYGFDIDFVEETDQLKSLKDAAIEASKSLDKKYKLDLSVTNPEAIQEQIKKGEELRDSLEKGTKEYEAMDKQLSYLSSKGGSVADALNFDLNYNDNKDEIDGVIEKLKTLTKYSKLAETINFETNAINIGNQIEDVYDELIKFKSEDGTIDLKQEGAQELFDIFTALINKRNELNRPAIAKLDTNDFEDSYQEVMILIQNYQNAVDKLRRTEIEVKAGVQTKTDEEQARKELNSVIDSINNSSGENKKMLTRLGIKPGSLDQKEIDSALAGVDANVMINAGFVLSEEAKATMNGAAADVTKKISADTTAANQAIQKLNEAARGEVTKKINIAPEMTIFNEKIKDATKTEYKNIIVKETRLPSGAFQATGTANFSGKAYADGNIGAKQDETALVGELGAEMRVRDGQWELVGQNGAEFTDIKKDDIIFNAQQTAQLLKSGKTKSRGRAFVEGTIGKLRRIGKGSAYADGKYSSSGSLPGSNKFYNGYNKDKDKKKKDGKEDTYKETFDWIEVAIQRIEEAISRLDIVAQSTYKSFTKRNSTLSQEFNKVTEQIDLQRRAYSAYMAEANKINLSSEYKKKVQNGTMSIETLKGEGNKDLVERIKEYQSLFDRATEANDKILELQENLADLASQRFDNVVSEYDAKLSEIETKINKIETGLGIVEASGQFASRNYYDTLMSIEQENINMLTNEYNALNKAFNEAMATGTIEAYSEQWYSMRQEINEVSESLLEAQQSLIEYKNEMREMDWSIFEKTHEYISELSKESDFLIELLSFNESELFSKKTGKFTDKADSIAGLRSVNYNQYMAQADMYRKKVEEINKELANDPTNTILIDKKNEYIEAQRESILAANDERQAIIDLIENSYEKQLEILQELIDKRKEALNAEKDLYDYQKNITEQTKNLTDLQKQYLALQNDDSESAISKKQQLQDQIEQSKSDLEDSEYERWISDQQILLDQLYDEYETILMSRLDNIDGLITEVIDSTNANSSTIDQTIKDTTANVGYQVTDGMKNIWSDTGNGIGKIVADYSNNFSNTMTTTNSYIQQCVNLLNQIVAKANANSSANTGGVVKPTTPPSSGGGSSSSTSKPTTTPPASKPSSSSSGSKGSFFVYKKDSYPKSKLQKETSIVDRLNVRAIMV